MTQLPEFHHIDTSVKYFPSLYTIRTHPVTMRRVLRFAGNVLWFQRRTSNRSRRKKTIAKLTCTSLELPRDFRYIYVRNFSWPNHAMCQLVKFYFRIASEQQTGTTDTAPHNSWFRSYHIIFDVFTYVTCIALHSTDKTDMLFTSGEW